MPAPSTSANLPEAQAKLKQLLSGPAGKPPLGTVPNFHDPPNLDAVFIATTAVCGSITALAVLIRMYTKLFLIRSTVFEDYVIVTAFIGEIGFFVISTFILQSGGGIHMWDLRLKNFFRVLYWVNIGSIIYGIVIFLIKLSILLQYLRIFVPVRKDNMRLFVAIHIVIWSTFVFYLVNTVFEIARCQPREKIWNLLITGGHCFDVNATQMATGIFNIISDFVILVLPTAPIWKLQMPLKRKLMVTAIFATGILACATSIARTVYTWKIVQTPDVNYNIFRMGLWTAAELATGILVSCLPVIPRFFQHFDPKIYSTLSHGSKVVSIKIGQSCDSKGSKVQPDVKSGDTYVNGSLGSETLRGSHGLQSSGSGYGKYVTLEGFDMTILKREESLEQPAVPRPEQAWKRSDQDAESGLVDLEDRSLRHSYHQYALESSTRQGFPRTSINVP